MDARERSRWVASKFRMQDFQQTQAAASGLDRHEKDNIGFEAIGPR
jgi:hypothetical protein